MSEQVVMQCPVCKLHDQQCTQSDGAERLAIVCERCGRFTITAIAARKAGANIQSTQLSAWLRDQTDAGRDIPEINLQNLNTIIESLPTYSVSQKQLLLLKAISTRSTYPGHTVRILPRIDYPLSWASNENEFDFYVRTLEERGLVRYTDADTRTLADIDFAIEVTSEGWEYLDQAANAAPFSNKVFVAMSFSEEMKPVWEDAIRPAISDAGYEPYRIDTDPHIDRIDAKIIAEIRESRFLVADFTGHKQGVYFEAGYALGYGLPVIWTVRKGDLSKTHFDTRQYNHIVWDTPEYLRDQLFYVVCAVIGKRK